MCCTFYLATICIINKASFTYEKIQCSNGNYFLQISRKERSIAIHKENNIILFISIIHTLYILYG